MDQRVDRPSTASLPMGDRAPARRPDVADRCHDFFDLALLVTARVDATAKIKREKRKNAIASGLASSYMAVARDGGHN